MDRMELRMDAQRFAALVDAYGAESRRWPAAERDAARAFAAEQPHACEPLLAAGRETDSLLSSVPVVVPGRKLRKAIMESAPKPRRRAMPEWMWLPGAGLAAACAAGAVFGAVLTRQVAAETPADAVLAMNAESVANDASDVTEAL